MAKLQNIDVHQQRFAAAGRAHKQDIWFWYLRIILDLAFSKNSFVVVINADAKDLFGLILTDNVVI